MIEEKKNIYFKEKLNPWKSPSTGMNVSPIQVPLLDGSVCYFLGEDWKDEAQINGAIIIENFDENLIEPPSFDI